MSAFGRKRTFEFHRKDYCRILVFWRKNSESEKILQKNFLEKGLLGPFFDGYFVKICEKQCSSAVFGKIIKKTFLLV